MTTTIECPFNLSPENRKHIKQFMDNLGKYEKRITQSNVFFKEDDGNTPNDISVQIRVRVPGEDIFVQDTDPQAMTAFGKAYKSLKRQVKKRREKLNDHQSPIRELNEIVNNTY